MISNYISWAIRVTHLPTGESVTLDSNNFRSQHKARDVAIKLLKARIYAKHNSLTQPAREIATYDLPDDEQFPNDLTEYRCDV